MRTSILLVSGIVVLALAGCTPPASQPRVLIQPPLTRGVLSEIPSSSLPAILTDGPAAKVYYRSPNVTPAVGLLRRIETNQRHASADGAAKSLSFTPRLPLDTGGAVLEYLLTSPDGPGGSPRIFWAVYSGGALQIAEWRQAGDANWQPAGTVATQTVHGLPATINLHGSQGGQTNVLWKEGDMVFNVWYSGSLEDTLRVAESVPRR